jgi:1-aminocyclopropane-1-carboxylate deaminase
MPPLPILAPSSVDTVRFRGQTYFVKRDDLLHPWFNGNKARKFATLLQTPATGINRLVSIGGNQSNSLPVLAALAQWRGWQFDYYLLPVPAFLKNHPSGNYAAALALGAVYHEVLPLQQPPLPPDCWFVPQGGADAHAAVGLSVLAAELRQFVSAAGLQQLAVFLPSGTGTTALYLQQYLYDSATTVYTTPCVGKTDYLSRQFATLCPEPAKYPVVLEGTGHYRFGALYPAHLLLWQALREETGIEFDLLYDPVAWQVLLQHRAAIDAPVLYLHCGGLSGNSSLLARYRYAGYA